LIPDLLDIAVIVVSCNSARWIACLRNVFAQIGGLRADLVVVDANSPGGTTRSWRTSPKRECCDAATAASPTRTTVA
jgi:GT2 family glycosyltransferase